MKINIFQINTELFKVTGVQRVMMDIHEALKDEFNAKIIGTISFKKVNENLKISRSDYMSLKKINLFKLKDSVIIVHERRLLPLLWLLCHIPLMKIRGLYIHHNELYGNKRLSLFPKNVVAISDTGIKNLTEYFNVPDTYINKIHNCVREFSTYNPIRKRYNSDNIKIIYPARINDVKRQIEIVKYLRGKLDRRIKILFAGIGPLYNELNEICREDSQFEALGFRSDIPELLNECDFMLLFTKHEGLPISLIEATKAGLPVICNNVGGNTEIIYNGINGIVVDEWDSLLDTLNNLPTLKQSEIDKMSKATRKIYENNFRFDTFKNKYITLIKSII